MNFSQSFTFLNSWTLEMTTSPTRYLCGYPIWFELRDLSASSSSNLDKSASSDEILTKNDEKLTMKRIVDHMKRNHVAYAKLNVRTSPESIESVRFITFTYQIGRAHV